MTAIALNLPIEQNATFRRHMVLASFPYSVTSPSYGVVVHADTGMPADIADIIPVDLTGCTARLQGRTPGSPTTPAIDLSTEDGGIVLGGTTGTIDLYMPYDDVILLPSRAINYDMLILYSGGDILRMISGAMPVSAGVTRVQ